MKHTEVIMYLLRDILEMQYSQDPRENNRIISLLLARKLKNHNIYPISCFILDDNLIAIKNENVMPTKHIWLLDGRTKKNVLLRNIGKHGNVQTV